MDEERIVRKGFGRLIAPDPDDKKYPMRAALRPVRVPQERYYAAARPLPYDQGETGTCVAHAWAAFLACAPLMCRDTPNPYDLYRKIVLNDEFRGNDREALPSVPNSNLQFGSSIRGGAKTLQAMGNVKSYVWAKNADEGAMWLLSGHGTLVLGTDWFWDMGTPDARGYVNIGGGAVGGHAYLAIGYSRVKMAFRCLNSWGREYGQSGRFWVRHADMDKLIKLPDAEMCAAVEQYVPPQG